HHQVYPHAGPLLRNHVLHGDAVIGLPGPGGGLKDVAGPAQRDADVTVGEVVDVLGAVEVGDIRLQSGQQRLDLARHQLAVGGEVVGVLAQVVEHRRNHLGGLIQNGDAAAAQLLQ